MTRRQRLPRVYPDASGRTIRFTRPTASEKRRHQNTGTWRVGFDVVAWVRETAQGLGCTQGELVRALVLAGRAALDAGELVIESGNGRKPPEIERTDGSDLRSEKG